MIILAILSALMYVFLILFMLAARVLFAAIQVVFWLISLPFKRAAKTSVNTEPPMDFMDPMDPFYE